MLNEIIKEKFADIIYLFNLKIKENPIINSEHILLIGKFYEIDFTFDRGVVGCMVRFPHIHKTEKHFMEKIFDLINPNLKGTIRFSFDFDTQINYYYYMLSNTLNTLESDEWILSHVASE